MPSISQADQAGRRRGETKSAIEAGEMRFEIDMQPFGSALASQSFCSFDQSACDASPPKFRIDAGIEDEGVTAAIPGDIDETDQPRASECAYMSEISG